MIEPNPNFRSLILRLAEEVRATRRTELLNTTAVINVDPELSAAREHIGEAISKVQIAINLQKRGSVRPIDYITKLTYILETLRSHQDQIDELILGGHDEQQITSNYSGNNS